MYYAATYMHESILSFLYIYIDDALRIVVINILTNHCPKYVAADASKFVTSEADKGLLLEITFDLLAQWPMQCKDYWKSRLAGMHASPMQLQSILAGRPAVQHNAVKCADDVGRCVLCACVT